MRNTFSLSAASRIHLIDRASPRTIAGVRSYSTRSVATMRQTSSLPHQEPNEWDVFVLLDMQKDGLIAGYDELHGAASGALRRTILIGVLITLASMKEAFKNASGKIPALAQAIKPYEADLARWERMRHDVAHLFDRVFQPVRKNANDPWIPNGFQIAGYDPTTDTVRTGASAEGVFHLYDAIERAFEACNAAEVRVFELQHGRDGMGHEPVKCQIEQIRNKLQREA